MRRKVWVAWYDMKKRCYNPNCKAYKNYGARGISVCASWLEDFEIFYSDMGDPPDRNYSLDRIDTFGNYEKENCKWSTKTEQNLNKRQSMSINKSGYRGVVKAQNREGFVLKIGREYLGYFKSAEEAALAYNQKATELYGNKAILNEVK